MAASTAWRSTPPHRQQDSLRDILGRGQGLYHLVAGLNELHQFRITVKGHRARGLQGHEFAAAVPHNALGN